MRTEIFLMKTGKKYLLLGQLLVSFFSFTMELTNLPFDWIKQCIQYLEPSYNESLLDEQENELEKDKQNNPLKYFCRNIQSFSCVNKKINDEINNFFQQHKEPFPFYKDMIQLHKEKELLLFYCPCIAKDRLDCVIKLHFFAEGDNRYNLDCTYNYALIFYFYKYDTCVQVLKIAPYMNMMALDAYTFFFMICKNHTESDIARNSFNKLEYILHQNDLQELKKEIVSVEVLSDANLYKLPINTCTFVEPFTYNMFCQLMELRYDERVTI